MTTEEDFQAALDKNPSDWQTRLVFADWLQERGDPRAEGYRVLGRWMCAFPEETTRIKEKGSLVWPTELEYPLLSSIPLDWFAVMRGDGISKEGPLRNHGSLAHRARALYYKSRRDLENAAAAAFTLLTSGRRGVLLAGPD